MPIKTLGRGAKFYARMTDLVAAMIKPIFVESGEWPGAYDQHKIQEIHEKLRAEFPECVAYDKMNWSQVTSWMGTQLKRKR